MTAESQIKVWNAHTRLRKQFFGHTCTHAHTSGKVMHKSPRTHSSASFATPKTFTVIERISRVSRIWDCWLRSGAGQNWSLTTQESIFTLNQSQFFCVCFCTRFPFFTLHTCIIRFIPKTDYCIRIVSWYCTNFTVLISLVYDVPLFSFVNI